jgi:hypothetical protein
MKTITLITILLATTLVYAQSPSQPQPAHADTNNILIGELPNMKSDLAELRAMLNVLASQESGADMRTSAALQTNRKMWQVVIARLAELTQRIDAMERAQNTQQK